MTIQAQAVFDRIVCGIDGSPEALEAARQAEKLRPEDGTLRLVAVAPRDLAVHAGWASSHVLDEIDSMARTSLRAAVDEVHPSASHVVAGDAATCLLEEVESADATLVAVGPRGRSRAAGILLGKVATTLLHDAPCSVLLAREPRDPERFPSRIVVGIDGSPESERAAEVADELAERFAAKLERVVKAAHPVDQLVRLSEREDLVVVGSRGLTGIAALGSVSERVGHRARCSVLVVR